MQSARFACVLTVLGRVLLVNDRPPGSYPKTVVMSGWATIRPELLIAARISHGNVHWSVTVSLNAQQSLTEWAILAGAR